MGMRKMEDEKKTNEQLLAELEALKTKCELAEEALEDCEEKLRTLMKKTLEQQTSQQEVILNSIPAFIYFKDSESKLIAANRAFAEMVNTPVDQLPGKDAHDLFPKGQAEKFHNDDRKIMESGKPMMNIEEQYTDAEGRTRWASTSKVPYFDENGEVIGMVGITLDIIPGRSLGRSDINESIYYGTYSCV